MLWPSLLPHKLHILKAFRIARAIQRKDRFQSASKFSGNTAGQCHMVLWPSLRQCPHSWSCKTSGLTIHLTNAAYTTFVGAMCCLPFQPDTHDNGLKNTFLQRTFENYTRNRSASDGTSMWQKVTFLTVLSWDTISPLNNDLYVWRYSNYTCECYTYNCMDFGTESPGTTDVSLSPLFTTLPSSENSLTFISWNNNPRLQYGIPDRLPFW